MSTFTDDFNRGDGGLGNNWSVLTGTANIASNRVTTTGSSTVLQTTINASGRQEGICTLQVATIGDVGMGPWLKASSPTRNGYVCYASGTLASPIWHLRRMSNAAFASDISVGGSNISVGQHTLRFLYDAGLLNLWFDGSLLITAADSTWGGNTGAGFFCNAATTGLDTFTLLGDETVTFAVTPEVIGNFGNATTVSFAGLATAWTPGTPGAPTFTVDHGTLTSQVVTSATEATATYTPGNFLGIATFADPSTAATDTVVVTSDTSQVPPTGSWLSTQAVAYIERSAADGTLPVITNRQGEYSIRGASIDLETLFAHLHIGAENTQGSFSGSAPDPAYLGQILQWLSGSNDPPVGPFLPPGAMPLAHSLDFLAARWADSGNVSPWTLEQGITTLAGDPLASHQDILTAIDGIVGGDNQDVLDAIAAMQGDPLATIKAVLDRVYLLDPTGTHNLADLLAAIAAIEPGSVDLTPVLDAIDSLKTYLHGEHETIRTELAAGFLVVSAIQTLLGSATGTVANVISGVTDILSVANEIKDTMSAATVPPIWIDEAHADVGESVPLTNTLELTGPLDGLIVTVDTAPSGAGKFAFGDVRSWRYVGAVIFQSDRGDWEWAQPIGLTSQIITPRTMQHASAARFRVESGWQGTVRAFTVTAGA